MPEFRKTPWSDLQAKYTNCTRFNPTPSGDLHLGHVYLCLVNEYEAHRRGGKFHLRFDDDRDHWTQFMSSSKEMLWYSARILEDLRWMGIVPETVLFESEMDIVPDLERIYGYEPGLEKMAYKATIDGPTVVGMRDLPYPYTPAFVPEKVWLDFLMGINHLIRGIDLITEFSLYQHWVDRFRLPPVKHYYVPRLAYRVRDGAVIEPISKTHGNLTIRHCRKRGMQPWEIRTLLAAACLKNPGGMWSVDNIREDPIVTVP